VIERIVAPLALRVDESSLGWMRDCRTAVGCRPDFFAPLFERTAYSRTR
jgi:hypothetical protein